MKKLLTTFAAVGLLGMTACAVEDEEPVIIDEPVVENPAPAPMTPPPAPMPMETDSAAIIEEPAAPTTPPAAQ